MRMQDPSLVLKKDVERFLWNFLALRTSSGPAVDVDGMTLFQNCNSTSLIADTSRWLA